MSLFAENKDFKVRALILKLVNNSCPELKGQIEDARSDNRVNLAIVVAVVPIKAENIQFNEAFTAVTKDFSSTGVAIVCDQPLGLDQVILGFRMDGEMAFLRAEAKHLNPMGGGLFQLGFRLLEVVSVGDYPGLECVNF
jgi:hypothetical protein